MLKKNLACLFCDGLSHPFRAGFRSYYAVSQSCSAGNQVRDKGQYVPCQIITDPKQDAFFALLLIVEDVLID